MLTEKTVREIVAEVITQKLSEKCNFERAALCQLATEFAAAQRPLVKELCEQREDLGHAIRAVKDMQTAMELVCERLNVVMERPTDPDDWWKDGGEPPE